MNCKTCKYWYVTEEYKKYDQILEPYDSDTYEPMVMPFEVRLCNSPKIAFFERNPDPKGISLCDGSNYMIKLCTGPDFGCVNYEEKDAISC